MKQCNICKEFYNPTILSEVFDHEHKEVSTEKEYFGKEIKYETCTRCGGLGRTPNHPHIIAHICERCKGVGKVKECNSKT